MTEFTQLKLKKEIVNVLSRLKYKEAFEVQKRIIPLTMQGKNVVFTAMTGSGKTLAYSLGFLSKINIKQNIQMLILVPTRELCIQVSKELIKICDPLGINVGALYGGRDIKGDYKTLQRKIHIYVGTPGRLVQHINEKNIKVGEVRFLIFDESDQMFDLGFFKDCIYLRRRVSSTAQIILSSATITEKVEQFIKTEIGEHEFVKVGLTIPENIVQEKVYCKISKKNELLLKFFSFRKFKRSIVFCNTKQRVNEVVEFLRNNKISANSLSSTLTQQERLDHLNLFKDGKISILVCTDVAARGIHIEDVSCVVNYDIPTKLEFYVHRIGRTGRKGKKGYALSMICPEDDERFDNIVFDYELNVIELNLEPKPKYVTKE
ncbi:DEAD/DEAH box helicase [Candidatus Woesearchaeota archaeon]|nr:DEAD/DEAH box helicase [Candidatus Woesearchaeota archaeon]